VERIQTTILAVQPGNLDENATPGLAPAGKPGVDPVERVVNEETFVVTRRADSPRTFDFGLDHEVSLIDEDLAERLDDRIAVTYALMKPSHLVSRSKMWAVSWPAWTPTTSVWYLPSCGMPAVAAGRYEFPRQTPQPRTCDGRMVASSDQEDANALGPVGSGPVGIDAGAAGAATVMGDQLQPHLCDGDRLMCIRNSWGSGSGATGHKLITEVARLLGVGLKARPPGKKCSRLTIRARFNLRCLVLPALIGLLIDLSHAYITTFLPGSFRAPRSWDVWSVNRQAGSPV
jgi:hypothetical protein